MALPAPLLVQLSEPSRRIAALPSLKVGDDGLLRREGMATPIVNELFMQAIEPKAQMLSVLETVVTRGFPDQPDPFVRFGREDRSVGPKRVRSTAAKAQPNNPSLCVESARVSDYLQTIITKDAFDQPDPNRSRRGFRDGP
jgi:hypothetical protein